jgi:GDP-4-dehydro-6-deoxy-D-mannose reductase
LSVVVTGATGFAGRHLAAACRDAGDDVRAWGRGDVDLRDPEATRAAIAAAAPAVVYHLAAQAHVGRSWEDPAATLQGNLAMTLHVLEAVRAEAPEAVVVAVSSGEVYGPPAALPVTEDAPLRPQNPYAVSKAAADLLAGFHADAHGLRVVRVRAFNHSGPGQAPVYAISSFARQVAAGALAGDDPVRVVTGNAHTRRDFTDVRDVVRAYRLLAARGEPGVFNVCSGRTASAAELVSALGEAAAVAVEHEVDAGLMRANEVMEIVGSAEALHAATGWRPEIPLERTLADAVAWWREQLAAS